MAYNTGIPAPSDSPASFPAQATINWTRLKAIINTDHQFNDAGGATADGYHTVVNLLPQAPGATPGLGRLYSKTNGNIAPHYKYPDTGALGAVPEAILPTVMAYGIFTARADAGSLPVVGQSHNCSVTWVSGTSSSSVFLVTFTSALPDVNYIPYIIDRRTGGTRAFSNLATNQFNFSAPGSSENTYGIIVYYLPPA